MNDPDFKPRALPPLPKFLRPVFVGLACLAGAVALVILVWALFNAPHAVVVH